MVEGILDKIQGNYKKRCGHMLVYQQRPRIELSTEPQPVQLLECLEVNGIMSELWGHLEANVPHDRSLPARGDRSRWASMMHVCPTLDPFRQDSVRTSPSSKET